MKIVYPPDRWLIDKSEGQVSVFLEGAIDNGGAVNWQEKVTSDIDCLWTVAFNPRRLDWDSSWEQNVNFPEFRNQVIWELDHLDLADFVLVHFPTSSVAPISLLELGYLAGSRHADRLIVCAEIGYWRRGNIEVLCRRAGIPLFETLDDATDKLLSLMSQLRQKRVPHAL